MDYYRSLVERSEGFEIKEPEQSPAPEQKSDPDQKSDPGDRSSDLES